MPCRILALLLTLTLAGAAGCGGSRAGVTPAAQSITVSVSPGPVEVVPGGTMSFTASVTGTASTAVSWSVQEGADGGAIAQDGTYTAPAAPGTYHVVATSVVDSTATAVVAVTVSASAAAVVVVAPADPTVDAGARLQFSATVYNTKDQAVTWSVEEGAAGGAITSAGLYTAPTTPGTYTIVASKKDTGATSTLSGRTTLAAGGASGRSKVRVRGVAVSIAPGSVTLAPGGLQAFTASVTGTTNGAVTWSVQEATGCGSISQAGNYVAPAAAATCHVVATSAADVTKTAVAAVTVTPPSAGVSIAVSPASRALDACASLQLTASVSGTTNQAVTWAVQEGAAGGSVTSAGVYTAPGTDGTYHVVATSAADTTRTAVATLTVANRVLSVTVSPASASVQAGSTAQFTATVTTTCGQFTSTQALALP